MKLAATAGLVVALASGGAAQAGLPSLFVDYKTADCTFTFKDDNGKSVGTVLPGTYQVVVATSGTYGDYYVSDDTGLRACKGFVSFRLTGPGVSVGTTLDDGDSSGEILSATLKPGATYTVQDNHNVAGTKRSFAVAKSGTANAMPLRGTVDVHVTTKGATTLLLKGKPVSSLRHGRWTFAVHDESTKAGLSLERSGHAAIPVTTASFIGFRDLPVDLVAGKWSYFTPGGEKRVFVVS